MNNPVAPGLTADWLNGWLAAVGVTVLLPGVRLGWTDEAVPNAVFHQRVETPIERVIAAALPTESDLAAMTIRPQGPGGKLGQTATRETYKARAAEARASGDWTLSVAHTDLAQARKGEEGTVPKGPFNAGMEGDQSLWKRVAASRSLIGNGEAAAQTILRTLEGIEPRVMNAGLAFDGRRFSSGVQHENRLSSPRVLPVVELLAFYGISLFPVRGNGSKVVQRGWTKDLGFVYPTWSEKLDVWAIDALLDWTVEGRSSLLGVTRRYRTRDYLKLGGEKRTAYFAERIN